MLGKSSLYRYFLVEGVKRELPPHLNRFVRWFAVGISLYNVWAVFGYPEELLHRGLSFGLFFALAFLVYTMPGSKTNDRIPWYDWLLAVAAVAVSVYLFANVGRLLNRLTFFDKVYPADIGFGLLTIGLLLEGSRRIIGPWLAMLSVSAIAYAFCGRSIPGLLGHTGFAVHTIVDELFLTNDGIWGGALGMAATYIFIFILFGTFFQRSGAGDFLFDFAAAISGRSRGGLAKIGVIASGLFGMISGSPMANVTTVGTITIPMMKKTGYPADFAAAVECTASTGGTIMPPVMGSVAFIMAEVIGVPYFKVALAALIPAVIYYTALYFVIHFRSGKMMMKGLSAEEIPPFGKTMVKGMLFFIPLIFLITRLMAGYSPSRVGLETIVLIVVVSWLRPQTRMTLDKIFQALSTGAIQGIMIITTMATSGIIIGMINLTGVGNKFSSILMALSGNSSISTLIFAMLLAMLLGCAMNITTSYLLTAVIAAPVLIKMGITPMAAHMFILFFAAMAPITPPVALTAFTAASIADAPPMWVGFLAMRITAAAYFMPFIFIYQPALLLDGTPLSILVAFISGLLAVALLAMGLEGWFGHNLTPWSRVMLIIAGLLALTGYFQWVGLAVLLTLLALGYEKIIQPSVNRAS